MRYLRAWLLLSLRQATYSGRPPGKPAGVRPRSGPAAVNAKAERCRVARQGVADVSAQGCARPLARGRPVTPGPPWRNPGHACSARHPSHWGTAKEKTTGRPQRPKMKPGADEARLLSDNEDGMHTRTRTFSPFVPAQAGTQGPNA